VNVAPQFAIAVPAAGAFLIAILGRWPNLRETVTLVTAGLLLAVVAAITPEVLAGAHPSTTLLTMLPGLTLELRVEPLGMLFALVASSLCVHHGDRVRGKPAHAIPVL
jgi:multicomponent Na+:H+ antiporter subunit D